PAAPPLTPAAAPVELTPLPSTPQTPASTAPSIASRQQSDPPPLSAPPSPPPPRSAAPQATLSSSAVPPRQTSSPAPPASPNAPPAGHPAFATAARRHPGTHLYRTHAPHPRSPQSSAPDPSHTWPHALPLAKNPCQTRSSSMPCHSTSPSESYPLLLPANSRQAISRISSLALIEMVAAPQVCDSSHPCH